MDRKMRYEKPQIDIEILLEDIICTSSMKDEEVGSGGSIPYPMNIMDEDTF